MPTKKKGKGTGRPARYVMPPKIDATPETIAEVVLGAAPPEHTRKRVIVTYRCAECGCEVAYPDTLYQDGRCADCTEHVAA